MVRTSPLSFKILLNTLTVWSYIKKSMHIFSKIRLLSIVFTQVLEGCVKNCGKRFHQHVVKKSFLADFAHLILPKYSPAEEVRQRAVTLLRVRIFVFFL